MSLNSICEQWEGRTIDGKFPLLEWLGGWADQCVFLTVRQAMQTANIKLIQASGDDASAYEAKWEAARTLPHPHLVKVMESGRCSIEGKDLVYVVTEKADAVLSGMVPRKALTASTVKAILDPIVDALSFVHERGFIHGRVKPPNIVRVGESWKLSVEELIASGDVQRPAVELGAYDAPEVASGNYTPASDVWSLGMIVIEAFTQRIPEASANGSRNVPDSLPEPFFEIARRCVRRDPAERCSVADVRTMLGRYESQSDSAELTPSKPHPVVPEPIVSQPVVPQPPADPVRITEEQKRSTEKRPASAALPFEESEPIELTPRSRLFTNIEDDEERRSRLVPILFGLVILVGAAAVLGVREYRIKGLRIGDVLNSPAPTQPSSQSKTQPEAQNAAPAGQTGSQTQTATPAAQPATQPQSAAPANPPPPQTSTPAENQQTAPAPPQQGNAAPAQPQPSASPKQSSPAREATPAPAVSQPRPEEPAIAHLANAGGAVLRRVIPTVAPGARESMRRPVEVEVRVSVNEHGTVSAAEYLTQGPGNYFARVAHDAAKSWKFSPPEREGHPRASTWTLRFRFDRRHTEAEAVELR